MSETPPMSTGVYRNRFLQAIMLSTVFLQIGIWVRNFAILLFVMDRTGNNPYAVSFISVAELPRFFCFPLSEEHLQTVGGLSTPWFGVTP